MSNKQERGYMIIEPPIHKLLNWDLDLIVSCLEILRQQIPIKFQKLPESIEYDLLVLENPFGPSSPAIGMHAPDENDLEKIPDWFEFQEEIDNWVSELDLEALQKAAYQQKILTWAELEKQGVYPNR